MEKSQILEGNLWKVMVKMTIPVILANLIQSLYNLADTYFVSRIGEHQMAAVTFVWPIIFLVISIAQGISIAGISVISKSIGNGDRELVRENIQQLIYISALVSVVLGVIGFLFSGSLLKVTGIEGLLLEESAKYIKWILLATPAIFMTLCHASIRKAEGETLKPMIVSLISIIANVILNPIFIFQMKMGITGAAIATVLARVGATIYCLFDLKFNSPDYGINFKLNRLSLEKSKEIITISLPAVLSQATTSFGFIVLNLYVKDYGAPVLAAYGIGNRIHSILFMPAGGIGNTLSAVVGQNYGARKHKRMIKAVKNSMVLSLAVSAAGVLIIQIFTREIAAVFAKDETTLYHTVNYMKLVSMTVIAWGIFQVHMGFFQGLGVTKEALKLNIVRLWILRIPMVIILTYMNFFKEYSIWYSMFFSNVLTALVSIIIYKNIINRSGFKLNAVNEDMELNI